MTEVVRTKTRNISILTSTTSSILLLMFLLGENIHLGSCYGYRGHPRRQRVELLQFGNKCSIPRQGGEVSIVTECDASKGLKCDGKACICTFADHFSYDPFSDECRKKLGKSCRVTSEASVFLELPFHQKCHSTATCQFVSRSLRHFAGRGMGDGDGGERDVGFSMCVCKPGMEPTEKLDGCRTPRHQFELAPLRDDHYDEEED